MPSENNNEDKIQKLYTERVQKYNEAHSHPTRYEEVRRVRMREKIIGDR